MKDNCSKSHYLEVDFRANSLNQIIQGLVNAINSLKNRLDEESYYDGIWLREDTEPIFGLALIAFQNYINSSIKDLTFSSLEKTKYYKLGAKFENYNKSYIELIIALANYAKHKEDDGNLHNATSSILESFNLDISKEADIIDTSPIFDGLTILSENWDLFEIEEKVKTWRANLVKKIINKHCT